MGTIERFQKLINQILVNSEFPIIDWSVDPENSNLFYSKNITTEKFNFNEDKVKEMVAFINSALREMGLAADFPFGFRRSRTYLNTMRILLDGKQNEKTLIEFFAKLDAVQFDLTTELYNHPTDPERVIVMTDYAIRRPVNKVEASKRVTFVLDRSESMRGQKLADLKKFTKNIIASLSSDDRYNILVFNHDAEIRAQGALKDSDYKDFFAFKATGQTNLLLPFELLAEEKVLDTQRRNVVIFVTDGQHNETEHAVNDICSLINEKLPPGTTLITIGVGAEYDFNMIKKLSDLAHVVTPIHIKDKEGFDNAEVMVAQMSAVQSLPVKLQLLTSERKHTLQKLGCLKLNNTFTGIVELSKSSLENAEILLMDSEKRCKRSKLMQPAQAALPIPVMVAWLNAKIHEALNDTQDIEASKVKLKYVQNMVENKLALDEKDPHFTAVKRLKWLLQEAQNGLENSNKDALLNAVYLSNPTQQSYMQAAQPLTWSQPAPPQEREEKKLDSAAVVKSRSLSLSSSSV